MTWSPFPTVAAKVYEKDATGYTALVGYMPSTTATATWTYGRFRFLSMSRLRMFTHLDFGDGDKNFACYNHAGKLLTTEMWSDHIDNLPASATSGSGYVEGATGLNITNPENKKYPYLAYFDSTGPAGGIDLDPYAFELVVNASSATPSPFIFPTCIPKLKYVEGWSYSTDGLAFDPIFNAGCQKDSAASTGGKPTGKFGVVYSQPSLVRLCDGAGGSHGWLLILDRSRSWSYVYDGVDSFTTVPKEDLTHSFWDVVCYYDPNEVPTFSTADTIGPFLLIANETNIPQALVKSGTTTAPICTWVGTCGGVVLLPPGEADLYLYLYYDIETPSELYDPTADGAVTDTYTAAQLAVLQGASTATSQVASDSISPAGEGYYENDFLVSKHIAEGAGTMCLRRVKINDLMAWLGAYAGGKDPDEKSWTLENLIPGENMGRVRFWFADGSSAGSVVDFRGKINSEVEAYMSVAGLKDGSRLTKVIDPEPRLLCGSSVYEVDANIYPLTIFFSVRTKETEATKLAGFSVLGSGHGFWHAWAIDRYQNLTTTEFTANGKASLSGGRRHTGQFGLDFVVSPPQFQRIASSVEVSPGVPAFPSGQCSLDHTAYPTDLVAETVYPTVVDGVVATSEWADSAPVIIPNGGGVRVDMRVFGGGYKTTDIDGAYIGVEGRIDAELSAAQTWTDCWTVVPPPPAMLVGDEAARFMGFEGRWPSLKIDAHVFRAHYGRRHRNGTWSKPEWLLRPIVGNGGFIPPRILGRGSRNAPNEDTGGQNGSE